MAETAAWSPAGHHRRMDGPAGVYAVDPSNGEFHWLYDSTCLAELI